MNSDYAQRRRFAVAAAITVIVVPTVLLLGRGNAEQASGTVGTAVGTLVPEAAVASPNADEIESGLSDTDSAMGELSPGFVSGEPVQNADDIPTIVFPNQEEGVKLGAEFSGSITSPDRCYVPGAPSGERVSITNTDNGRVIDCYNSASVPDSELVVMNMDAFTTIADLTDAPVPVEVTW